jgi:hypothetical protein
MSRPQGRKSIVNCQAGTGRLALRVLAILLALAVVPWPAFAQQPAGQSAAKPGIRASIAKAVTSARVAPAKGQSQTPADGKAQLASGSFFKKPVGMLVIMVVGAGTAYALYSASHDRIHSTIPPGLK